MKRIVLICNALDDATRLQRGISTDSPAASRKMFLTANALRQSGVKVLVVSLGRGRQDGSLRYFSPVARRVGGVAVIYLPYFHVPFLSEFVSFLFSALSLIRLRKTAGSTTAIFYNRTSAYLLGLFAARWLRFRTVLDLEDGEVGRRPWSLGRLISRCTSWLFDSLCNGGALLACTSLSERTALRPTLCYYGIVEGEVGDADWSDSCITVLLGGTVSRATGAALLADSIATLRDGHYSWKDRIKFEITGQGDCMSIFADLASDSRAPKVILHGRTSDSEYKAIVRRAHIGLALKPRAGDLANSTFPSKVIELAGAGVLVLTTNISDVASVLGEGALYLNQEEPHALIELLEWIEKNRRDAEEIAQVGTFKILAACSPRSAGQRLVKFLFANDD